MTPVDLGLVFILGLLGSVHCAGMCGGFVIALTHAPGSRLSAHAAHAWYYAGKTATYMLLGALAGGLGGGVMALLGPLQTGLSVTLAIGMVIVGLSLLGWLRALPGAFGLGHARWLSNAIGQVLQRRGWQGAAGLGLLNGLLPCALVYGLLVKAATTGSVLGGAVTMGVFGMATIPALVLTERMAWLSKGVWRTRANQVAAVLLIAFGTITLLRATPLLHFGHADHAMADTSSPVDHADPHHHHHHHP
ncbi:MAG: sulfite exporter TauE/SafE family protein [Bacteroidota bacterium]